MDVALTHYVNNGKLCLLIKPNAKKTEILGYDPVKKMVRIAVAAPADKDKANKELLKFVSKVLKKKGHFVSGLRSREKVLQIS